MEKDSRVLERGCPGGHEQLAGRTAAPSATYNVALTASLASVVVGCLKSREEEAIRQHVTRGSERLAVNELLMSAPWEESRRWRWQAPGHITLLESKVVTNWIRGLVLPGGAIAACAE